MLPHVLFGQISNMMFQFCEINTCAGGACLDTMHARLSGDLASVFHKLLGHLKMVHTNDNLSDWDEHLIPAENCINWPMGDQRTPSSPVLWRIHHRNVCAGKRVRGWNPRPRMSRQRFPRKHHGSWAGKTQRHSQVLISPPHLNFASWILHLHTHSTTRLGEVKDTIARYFMGGTPHRQSSGRHYYDCRNPCK